MKRIIRWLADISGVTDDLEKQTAVNIGNRMSDAAKWVSKDKKAFHCLNTYSEYLKNNKLGLALYEYEEFREKVNDIE
jgi:hypothetical protein